MKRLFGTLITLTVCTLALVGCGNTAEVSSRPPTSFASNSPSISGSVSNLETEKTQNPANSTNESNAPSPKTTTISASVTLLGDSVVLGAISQLKAAIPKIDIQARTGRKLGTDGLKILKKQYANNSLGEIVVISMGTNSLVREDIDQAQQIIGPNRQIVFINAYRNGESYVAEVNAIINEAAAAAPKTFTVVDWNGYVETHDDLLLAPDNAHLTAKSAPAYADLVKEGILIAQEKLTSLE